MENISMRYELEILEKILYYDSEGVSTRAPKNSL